MSFLADGLVAVHERLPQAGAVPVLREPGRSSNPAVYGDGLIRRDAGHGADCSIQKRDNYGNVTDCTEAEV